MSFQGVPHNWEELQRESKRRQKIIDAIEKSDTLKIKGKTIIEVEHNYSTTVLALCDGSKYELKAMDSSIITTKLNKSDTEILVSMYKIILDFFKGDHQNTKLWFRSPNLNFGGLSAQSLIQLGKCNKVQLFIDAALKGY